MNSNILLLARVGKGAGNKLLLNNRIHPGNVFIQQSPVELIGIVPAVFLRLNKTCFNQCFNVMAYRRLSKFTSGHNFGTLDTTFSFGHILQYFEPVGVSQRLRYFF